jgi:ABC-type multidrug transport system permease subunit
VKNLMVIMAIISSYFTLSAKENLSITIPYTTLTSGIDTSYSITIPYSTLVSSTGTSYSITFPFVAPEKKAMPEKIEITLSKIGALQVKSCQPVDSSELLTSDYKKIENNQHWYRDETNLLLISALLLMFSAIIIALSTIIYVWHIWPKSSKSKNQEKKS